MPAPAVRDAVDAVYRGEARRVFATLVRLLGEFDLAEEALHEAFRAALEQWPRDGVPANFRAVLRRTIPTAGLRSPASKAVQMFHPASAAAAMFARGTPTASAGCTRSLVARVLLPLERCSGNSFDGNLGGSLHVR